MPGLLGEVMEVSWRLRLACRELWFRRGRSLLSLLALALTVGLVVATGSIGALMQAGVATPAPLSGHPADLWVSSAYDVDYDLPAGLAARVEAVPGVAKVQPVLRRSVRVLTPPSPGTTMPRADTLTLLGVDPASYFAFHELKLAAGSLPSAEAPGLVALTPWAFVRDLSLGQPVKMATPSGDLALPLTGLIEVTSLAAAQQGLVLYAPLDTVADLFGVHNAVTTLEVTIQSNSSLRRVRASLEQALGPAYAVSAATSPGQTLQLWQQLTLGGLAFVDGLTVMGSVSLVYAVFASSARSRRRQIGLLRAAGARRGQVLALLVTEAAVLGLVGSALGLVLGFLFAWLGARLVLPGSQVPAVPPLSAGSLLLAVALGVLGSLAGALVPSMRAARQPPLAALRPSFSESTREAGSGGMQQRLSPLARPFPPIQLAIANLGRQRGRAVLIVCTLTLILAMALGNVGVLSLLGEDLSLTFGRLAGGDFVVLPTLTSISLRELAGQDTSDAPPLSPSLLEALENLRDRVWLMGGTTADVKALQVFPGQPTLLLDIEGYARMGGFRFQVGNWPSALEAFRQGPAVLLAPVVARRLNVGLGDPVQLDTLHGPVAFTVVGIGDSEFTTCVLALADGQTYFGANEVNAVEVKVRPGEDREAVQRALLDAVHSQGGTLLSLGQVTAQLRGILDQARLSIGLLIAVTGLVAGLEVVNAMLASIAERRREIGLLRAVGATRGQVGRMVLAETALLGIMAALIGSVLGWAVTVLFLSVARTYLGLSPQGTISATSWLPLIAASAAGLVLWPLLAMVGGLAAAYHAARLPVIQALYEIAPG
jgi:putative ABC transport system permease protein